MLRVAHVITDLSVGGAEMVLLRLLRGTDRSSFSHSVISLGTMGELGPRIERLGYAIDALGMGSSRPSPLAAIELCRILRRTAPAVVQTWMYHADLLGGLAGRIATEARIVWGVHQTDLPKSDIKIATRAVASVDRVLAPRLPDHVVFCSRASAQHHLELGYPRVRSSIIPNGFEITAKVEDAAADVRNELGVPEDLPLIGRVGRFHPQKDYRTFVAACRVLAQETRCHFVLVGKGLTDENMQLRHWIGDGSLRQRFHLLGLRQDIDRLHAAFDVAVSSSAFGESFPLVIGEAMMQETPVVATDVGDSALIVGDAGEVVSPSDFRSLARGIRRVLDRGPDSRRALGAQARKRVIREFSLARMVDAYETLYDRLARSGPR